MYRRIGYILIFSILVMMTGCSSYAKLQKSDDYELKFRMAKNYLQERRYIRAISLLEDVMPNFRGTSQAEDIIYLLGKSYMLADSKSTASNYLSASEYFESYLRNYPKGKYAEEVRFQIAYCYYLDSPDVRLDQTATENAIYSFNEYIEFYPAGTYVEDAYRYLNEMEDKMAEKIFVSAKLYYDLGLYGGNNYKACVVTAENMLKEYPDSKFREDAVFLILKAKAKEAQLSVAEKQKERYSEVVDEYYRYVNEFQNGKYVKEAGRILKEARHVVDN
ncbi:MAG: outer membrane protein assembly factor BamD [Paludibacteraceae bacterium]|nr:outer membrane protein assembly factor BamD [Paludibacteraceae bacterium]